MKRTLFMIFKLSLLLILTACQTQSHRTIKTAQERIDWQTAQAQGQKYMISTQGRYASLAAKKIFDQGGNLIDAMVAASFTISVERPQSTGIGGGGFLIYHDAQSKKNYAVDFRERAPLAARQNMLIRDGKADPHLSQNGALAVATPGLVAGLLEVHEKFGSLPLEKIMTPAIELAENGFELYPEFQRAIEHRKEILLKDPDSTRLFLTSDKNVPPLGYKIVQKELAQTLRLIVKNGRKGFYEGRTAQAIVQFSQKNGGILSLKDFKAYKVKWREPLIDFYKEFQVVSMPPPSSGGIHVIQFLKFLENDSLHKKGHLSAESIHLASSALQSAFADRAQYLGDPDFVKVPSQSLLDNNYILKRRSEVSLTKARKANEVRAGTFNDQESTETTHLSIIDQLGNAVATTQTINGWMGAAVVAPGTGIVLNNEMDDFAAQVGASNLFGAIGGAPNSIAPLKTPLSSMSPTLLLQDGKIRLSVGAPGGTRIISCVAQTILNYIEFDKSLYDSVSSVRYHHQWQPDVLWIEPPGPGAYEISKLQKLGYEIKNEPIPCNVMAVAKEGDQLIGVADPRDIGTALGDSK